MLSAVNGIVIYLFGMLLKVPEESLEQATGGKGNDVIEDYMEFFAKYFGTDRLAGLEYYKDTFNVALEQKLQDIEHKQRVDASYTDLR